MKTYSFSVLLDCSSGDKEFQKAKNDLLEKIANSFNEDNVDFDKYDVNISHEVSGTTIVNYDTSKLELKVKLVIIVELQEKFEESFLYNLVGDYKQELKKREKTYELINHKYRDIYEM